MSADFLLNFINILAYALWAAILARVVISWIPIGEGSPFMPVVRMIYQITEPILAPIRSVLPNTGMLDLSPMIAILLLFVVQRIAASVLGGL